MFICDTKNVLLAEEIREKLLHEIASDAYIIYYSIFFRLKYVKNVDRYFKMKECDMTLKFEVLWNLFRNLKGLNTYIV